MTCTHKAFVPGRPRVFMYFQKWLISIKLNKVSREIKSHTADIEKSRMMLHEHELNEATSRNNRAVSWRICRTIACSVKGSRRQLQNAYKTQPSSSEFLAKYTKPANEGGWGAKQINIEQIAELEPDFEHVQCPDSDKNIEQLF